MKGINFEEWKALVKKNRQALNTKSNIYRTEPESLTWGGPGANKADEYLQMHTITYNVTGMEVPSDWPTEIKSGKTLSLSIPAAPYGASQTVAANVDYTYTNDVLKISNVLSNITITVNVGEVLYENAKVGDYLYSDWSFGPTEKDGYLGRCVKKASTSSQNTLWATSSDSKMAWSTETGETGVANINTTECGQQNTNILIQLGGDKYPAAAWAILQFNGNGYLPSARQLDSCGWVLRNLNISSDGVWSSSERDADIFNRSYALCLSSGTVRVTYALKTLVTNKSIAFVDLSGPIGKPINTNGHEYVDLGLPSGTLWATMNVGASSTTEYGNYYMYGMGSKTYDSTDTLYDGTEDPLNLTKDTARVVWGGDWHMPTRAQIQELTANTTCLWVTDYNGSGINGGKFTATNGVVLFFPAAGLWSRGSQKKVGDTGYYWGTSPNGNNRACSLCVDNDGKLLSNGPRECGYSIRGVIG